ncbi:MAG: hypothetical protein V4476_20650 [Pseudomonadota bacterium]
MISIQPNSKSEILRATHILEVEVMAATAGEWLPEGRFQRRAVTLDLILQKVWKGAMARFEHRDTEVVVMQYQPATPLYGAIPGAWSSVDLHEGAALIVFCSGPDGAWRRLLEEPCCRRVLPFEVAFADVALASEDGMPPLPLPLLLKRTMLRHDQYGPLFALYVAARFLELHRYDDDERAAILHALENPALPDVARRILYEELHVSLLLADPAPAALIRMLIESTLRVLDLPGSDVLRDHVLHTYLPNLLGIVGGAVPKSAHELFADDGAGRERTAAFFDAAGAADLARWARA